MSKLLKKALSFVLLGSMVLSIAACAPKGVRSITSDEFKKAIKDAKVLAEDSDFMNIKGPEGSELECIQFGNDVRAKDGDGIEACHTGRTRRLCHIHQRIFISRSVERDGHRIIRRSHTDHKFVAILCH